MRQLLFILGLFFFTATQAQLSSVTAYWKLDDASGGANDEVSTNDGTDAGGLGYSAAAKINTGFTFSGANNSNIVLPGSFVLATDWTFSAWVKVTSAPSAGSKAGFLGGASDAITCYITSGLYLGAGRVDHSDATTSTLQLTLNTLQLVTFRYDATAHTLTYGVGVAFQTISWTPTITVASTRVGCVTPNFYKLIGVMDEVGIWDGVMVSNNAVDSLYNGGTGLSYPFSVGGGGGGGATPVAGNLYFDPVGGNDLNDGQDAAHPVQTLATLQTLATALDEGDTIFFADTVAYGSFVLHNVSGNAAYPITLTTWHKYGNGSATIKGMKQLSTWTSLGGNRWSKYDASLPTEELRNIHPANYHYYVMFLSGVYINGTHYKIGREPDAKDTYFDIESAYAPLPSTTGWYFIDNDNSAASGTYNNAWAEICEAKWEWGKYKISTQSGNTFNINGGSINSEERDYGFANQSGASKLKYFLLNDPDLCDNNGEWSYDASSQTITMYYNGALNSQSVYASNVDTVLSITNCAYVKVEDVNFQGGNVFQVHVNNSDNVTITDCNLSYSPYSAITARYSDNLTVTYDSILHGQNNGIKNFACNKETITNNYLFDIGTVPGQGGDTDGLHFAGISSQYGDDADTIKIRYNVIDSVGGTGIFVSPLSNSGSKVDIYRNIVMNYGNVVNDLAAIYMYGDSTSQFKRIRGNVTYRGFPKSSTAYDLIPQMFGIYLDERSQHWTVDSNYTYNSNGGYYQNPVNRHNTFTRNVIFDWSTPSTSWYYRYGMRLRHRSGGSYHSVYTKNYVVASSDSAGGFILEYDVPFATNSCRVDSNYYYNPFDNDQSHLFRRQSWPDLNDYTTLSAWRTYTGNAWEMASTFNSNSFTKDSTASYTYGKDIFYTPVNWSSTSHYFDLGDCSFKKLDGTYVSDSIEISPYKSTVLFLRTGSLATVDEELFMGTPLAPGGALPTPTNSLLIRRRIIYIQL